MTDDPKIAAMLAATDFVIRFASLSDIERGPTGIERAGAEELMHAVADRWLTWYQQHEVMKIGASNPPILYGPGEPPHQPCGAYVEPDWYAALPEGARSAYPWLTCSGVHDDREWHQTAPGADRYGDGRITFATHHLVSAWRAYYDQKEYPHSRCACGEAYGHAEDPMQP